MKIRSPKVATHGPRTMASHEIRVQAEETAQ